MDEVEPSRSDSSPLTNSGASSALKPECEDAANVMAVVESSHSASGPATNAGASSAVLKIQEKVSDYSEDLFDSTDHNSNSNKSSVEDNQAECDASISLPQDNSEQLDKETDMLRTNKKVRECDAPLSLPQVSANDGETGQLLWSVKRKRGPNKRSPWSVNEIHAVEKHMMGFIQSWKVPGKADCVRCIEADPLALKNRDWFAVKFYVKNRITALQKQV
ncbi:hypothetical protein MHYP_G00329130 [Metynnis hypsauchen]